MEIPVIDAGVAGVDLDLKTWIYQARPDIATSLSDDGYVLIRGLSVDSALRLETICRALFSDIISDNGEHTRNQHSAFVYSPVPYSARQRLLWHNENSFNTSWPTKLAFACVTPAAQGGETLLVDSRKLFANLDRDVKKRFLAKDVMYWRRYGEGLGKDWRLVFRAASSQECEQRMRDQSLKFSWQDDGTLQTAAVRPAAIRHPQTGEPSWFAQIQHWHPACLDSRTRAGLQQIYSPENMPRNCFYGNGETIDDHVVAEICSTYESLQVIVPLQEGDVLLIDNISTAHGRNPYSGERNLLVALAEQASYSLCAKVQPLS